MFVENKEIDEFVTEYWKLTLSYTNFVYGMCLLTGPSVSTLLREMVIIHASIQSI